MYTLNDVLNINRTITFLEENEQYGDDWHEEINTLNKIANNIKHILLNELTKDYSPNTYLHQLDSYISKQIYDILDTTKLTPTLINDALNSKICDLEEVFKNA